MSTLPGCTRTLAIAGPVPSAACAAGAARPTNDPTATAGTARRATIRLKNMLKTPRPRDNPLARDRAGVKSHRKSDERRMESEMLHPFGWQMNRCDYDVLVQ